VSLFYSKIDLFLQKKTSIYEIKNDKKSYLANSLALFPGKKKNRGREKDK
jgi:hypothetical protein